MNDLLKILPTITLFVAFASAPGNAAGQQDFGIGVIVGEPTGISAKWWVGDKNAFDLGAAWSFTDNPSVQVHGDYLYHRNYAISTRDANATLPWYFGLGGRLKASDNDAGSGRNAGDDLLGVRFPVGIGKMFNQAPIELFVEVVPILDVAPETDFSFNSAIGLRFYP